LGLSLANEVAKLNPSNTSFRRKNIATTTREEKGS
jgi:hypothetical protein